jgi:hypothetical protein
MWVWELKSTFNCYCSDNTAGEGQVGEKLDVMLSINFNAVSEGGIVNQRMKWN